MTQTAVDWFFEQAVKLLKNPDDIESLNVYHFVAKQMNKQQIENAVTYGNRQEFYDGSETIGKQYFKETYEDNK